MRNINSLLFLGIALSFALNGCRTNPSIAPTLTMESVPSTLTPVLPTPTIVPIPIGKIIVVTSVEDNGQGTLRQALLDANAGDTIEFDPSIFPLDQPKVIYLLSMMPIDQGNLIIDASHAGVILDGSKIPNVGGVVHIVSNNNTVSGFQMRNFAGAAIHISGGQNNVIKDNVFVNSDCGIGLWGITTSNNKISGNFVGVLADGVTSLPNRNSGITVVEGAHDNQIGPDNIIAFNGQNGIQIRDTNTIGNTIIQNSIHDNGWWGIRLFESNNSLSAPILLDFDLEAGTLVGIACADCTVEVFSDSGHEGAIYEGQAEVDVNGEFTFDNNTAFTGPYLTATATDANGNSSEFSVRTVGLRGSSTLQEGNNLLKTRIVTMPYQELADNRIGHLNPVLRRDICSSSPEENYRLQEVIYLGAKWIKLGFEDLELDIIWRDGGYSKFEITECQENTISLLVENGATIICNLNYWDEYFHAENWPDYGDEEEVQRFLEYTRFLVSHFKGRIQYYEILNEPNSYVEVANYINLIRQAIPVIHEADPEARIVVGGVYGLESTDSREYLFEILRSDIIPLVDVIDIHPMFGTSPQYEGEYYYYYPSLVQEIKDTATAHGFRGDYMAAEMVWRTPANPNPYEQPSEYTDTVAAKYYARGIVMNLGMNLWAGISGVENSGAENPFIVRTIRNLSEVMAGARAIELPIEILSEYTNIKSYSFSLPNDEMLIVLWADGVAVDNDPGIPSTLILPGHAGQKATGIDVLYGFEQVLVSSNENGDLVIRDFLLKDYPIVIRLSK